MSDELVARFSGDERATPGETRSNQHKRVRQIPTKVSQTGTTQELRVTGSPGPRAAGLVSGYGSPDGPWLAGTALRALARQL